MGGRERISLVDNLIDEFLAGGCSSAGGQDELTAWKLYAVRRKPELLTNYHIYGPQESE